MPERIPATGLIILRDGQPGEPEVTLSPLCYHYQHRAELEVVVQAGTGRASAFDDLIAAIGAALEADRTLGGLCDWVEPEAPASIDLPVEGAAALKAAVLLALVLVVGQRLLSSWFYLVARQKSAELFMLNVLLVTLGLAWLTELAGLSLALGAFIAGMLIGETEYRYQVEEDIKPFRDVLLGLFFIAIGMRLDVPLVLAQWWLVAAILGALLLLKLAVVGVASRLLGSAPGTALRSGLWLCAGGEFGFVVLAHGGDVGLVAPEVLQPVLAAMVLSLHVERSRVGR